MKKKLIGHLDADCFYVSAERVRFPFLRGQPVGVLGNQGACVIAKSYELKAKGVSTGTNQKGQRSEVLGPRSAAETANALKRVNSSH